LPVKRQQQSQQCDDQPVVEFSWKHKKHFLRSNPKVHIKSETLSTGKFFKIKFLNTCDYLN